MVLCEHCNKDFKNKKTLTAHQKSAKYCIISRENSLSTFKCKICDKILSSKQRLNTHLIICNTKTVDTAILEEQNNIQKLQISELKLQIQELQNKLENIAIESINEKSEKIIRMTKKYVKKLPRQHFEEKNVIYILTTERLKKDNIYILGKANNLTSRLSTYNKTDEHEIIYYEQCPTEELMSVIENMVFSKLNIYREMANRERFILPENFKIDIFINVIKDCIKFFS
jgi:hypothetical protein